MIQCNGFTLEVVKIKGGWAQKATMGDKSRYRPYYYKKDAVQGLTEWTRYSAFTFEVEFLHNFSSASELGLIEI